MESIDGYSRVSILLLITIVACINAGCTQRNTAATYCKNSSGIDWMEVEQTYSKDTVAKLAAELKAQASLSAKILTDNKGSLDLTPELSNISGDKTTSKSKVSQEFYQQAVAYRSALCNTQSLLDNGVVLTPEQRNRVVDDLLKLSESFGGIEEKEKKN